MAARACTLKLFWTILFGLLVILACRFVYASENVGRTVQVQDIAPLVREKSAITEAYHTGKSIRIFDGMFTLNRRYLKSDFELVMAQIEKLYNEGEKHKKSLEAASKKRIGSLREQNRNLRMKPLNSDHLENDQLYNLIVSERNVVLEAERTLDSFQRLNRLDIEYITINDLKYVTELHVIRNGRALRDQMPAIHTSFGNDKAALPIETP